MGVFSIAHEGAYNGTLTHHEPNIGFNEDYTSGIDMAIALVEARENEFAVLQAGIKEDMVAAMCEDYMDRVYINEATASGLLGKIKEILTKLLEKLKSIFHAFMAKLNSFFMDADKFYKKYASEIARKNFSNFHIKARECHVDRLNSFITYTDDTVNTGLIKSITDAKGTKVHVDWTFQSDVDKVMDKDFIGEKVISNIFSSDCLKNTSIEADFSDINKELEDYIFEDAETHDEWSGTSIVTSPWVGGLLSQKKFISDIKKANDKCEKKLENMIRKIEKDSTNITKAIGNKGEYSSNKYEYKHESYNWNILNEAEDAEDELQKYIDYIRPHLDMVCSDSYSDKYISKAKTLFNKGQYRSAYSLLDQIFRHDINNFQILPPTGTGGRYESNFKSLGSLDSYLLDHIRTIKVYHAKWYDTDYEKEVEDDLDVFDYYEFIQNNFINKFAKEAKTSDDTTRKNNFEKTIKEILEKFRPIYKKVITDILDKDIYEVAKEHGIISSSNSKTSKSKKEEKPKRVVKLGDNSKKYNDPKKIKYEEQKKAEQLRQEREEQERKAAEAERKAAEAERKAEEARKAKEAAERKKKEEEARKAREEAEKEAQRKTELAEKEAKAREEAIKKAEEDKKKAEAEAKKKEEEAKKAAEEAKRIKDEEDKKKAEAEAKKKEEEAKKAAEEAKKADEIAKEEARKKKEADEAAKKKVVSVPPSGSSGSGAGSPSSGDSSKDSTPPPEPPKSSETDKEKKQEEKKKKTEAKKPASAPEEHKGFGIETTPVYNVSGDKELTTLLKSVAWLQQYFSKYQECMSKSQSVRLSSAKKAMSQAKKIFAAAVAYNPKNENYEYYTAIGESAEFEAMMSME